MTGQPYARAPDGSPLTKSQVVVGELLVWLGEFIEADAVQGLRETVKAWRGQGVPDAEVEARVQGFAWSVTRRVAAGARIVREGQS